MFRDSKCKIERPTVEKQDGELFYNYITIAENVPCHLSVRVLSATEQTDSVAKIYYDYTLFTGYNPDYEIMPNDIIEVKRKGKTYKLKAGVSIPYNLTIQTRCEIFEIVSDKTTPSA